MKKLKLALTRALLYCKRLLKKPEFPILILLIPVLIFALGTVSEKDLGFATIALAARDKHDPITAHVTEALKEGGTLIRLIDADTPEDAEKLVTSGQADGAWIFPEALGERLNEYTNGYSSGMRTIRIIEREDNVFLMLARERLYSKLYPYCSYALFESFLKSSVPETDSMSDTELRSYYDSINVDGDLLEFSFINTEKTTDTEKNNYLVTPIRGLLATLMLLCSLASAMLYKKDSENGVYAMTPIKRRIPLAIICQAAPLILTAPAVMLSLKLCGVSLSFGREALMMLSYIFAATGFCLVLRRLCGSVKLLAAVIPTAVILILLICPIFIEPDGGVPLKLLLPPYYLICSVHDSSYILYSFIYGFAGIIIYSVTAKVTQKD